MSDEGVTRAVAQPSADWWRPTRALVAWLSALLLVQAVFAIVTPIVVDDAVSYVKLHEAVDAMLDGRDATADRLVREASERDDQGWGTIFNLVRLAVLVLLIVWAWRSAHNALALGRTGARLAPGWAIAAWFIPVANFVLVYLIFSDLWRSGDPDAGRGDGWRALPGSATVRAWWSTYAGGFVLTVGGAALAIGGVTDESTTRTLLLLGGALGAVASLLAIAVVREITARQEALLDRDPAVARHRVARHPVALHPVVPTTVDGPGWYVDPAGAHDHRYWDGTAWTEHVSTGGVASIAPVVPADWYPDPTGRFHWRYWTGHEWTEHVSRDQELFVDPFDEDE